MKNAIRTFIAVETSQAVRARVEELSSRLRAASADVKWVESHNLHLTLKFLGDVPVQEVSRACEAVGRAAAEVARFEMEIRGAGAFPNPGRPRTLWMGGGQGSEQMIVLANKIEAALAKLGYPKERRGYQPHLTIGRVRQGGPQLAALGRLLKDHSDFDAGRFAVSEVVVFSSTLTPTGPIYEALSRAKLGGG